MKRFPQLDNDDHEGKRKMKQHKQVALSLERQHLKYVKSYYKTLADINMCLGNIHRSIQPRIDKQKYRYTTEYVNQYISYTNVWNIKFVYNLENPEVALLQIFHLDYIFEHEPENRFATERKLLEEQKERFFTVNPYKAEQIQSRKQEMLDYIKNRSEPSASEHEKPEAK